MDQETGVCGLRRGISVPARRSKRPGSVREWDDPSGAPLSAAKSLDRHRRGRKRVNVVDILSGLLSVLACQRRRGRHVEQCRRFQHDHRHEKKTPPRLPSRLRTRFLPRAGPLPPPSCPRPLDSCLARAAASPPPTRTAAAGTGMFIKIGMFGGAERGAGAAPRVARVAVARGHGESVLLPSEVSALPSIARERRALG